MHPLGMSLLASIPQILSCGYFLVVLPTCNLLSRVTTPLYMPVTSKFFAKAPVSSRRLQTSFSPRWFSILYPDLPCRSHFGS